MTKLFILLATVFQVSFLYGQKYISCFGEQKTKWTEIVQNEYPMSLELLVDKDTIIENRKYKSIRDWCALRQDSSNSKLFIYNYIEGAKEDHLVMDLNLSKGDTFKFENPGYPSYVIVDSIYFINNRKVVQFDYKIQTYSLGEEKFKFIEGIGSNMGITYQIIFPMMDIPYLLCYQNDTSGYLSPLYDTCYFIFDNISTKETRDIKIFNNPTSDFITLELKVGKTYEISLIDVKGAVLKRFTTKAFIEKVDLRNFNRGLYFLKIKDNKGHTCTEKIIKK